MKVVIDIPESIIEHIKDGSFGARPHDRLALITAVMDGAPLPKGHGKLIDAWALDKEVINYVHNGDAESSKDCAKFSTMIITAPAVIEADKGVQNEVNN